MLLLSCMSRTIPLVLSLLLVTVSQVFGQYLETETANFIQLPISSIHGFIPMTWACSAAPYFMPNPGTQSLLHFHANWHCTYDNHPEFGRRFFGFHKQFAVGYNFYLASQNLPFAPTFYPAQNAIIPPGHMSRPQDSPCSSCTALPNSFQVAGGLGSHATLLGLGQAIAGWHNQQHGNIAGPGNQCGTWTTPHVRDMACFTTSPRDPIFWQYHSLFNEVQEAWHSLQDANVALVMDRSGSMASTIPGAGVTRLQAAKDAAQMFADMVDISSAHRLGLVSFSNAATTNLPLTSAASFSSALSTAMNSVTANGLTSIGAGLNAGQTLVTSGTQPRKGIVLLTDGQENVAPMIANVNLGDTHLCAVGFASPSNLDGAKLRNLAERQGGIWTSTTDPVELKKIFVQCFSNIFDAAQAIDPLDTLPYSSPISPPTIHGAMGDDAIIFTLGWGDSNARLLLSITSPSGAVVSLSGPGVQSRVGRTWHVVRVKLPYQGERDGDWTARAVLQPARGYVNGFSSLAVADWAAGTQLVRAQLATVCAAGCKNVLLHQDGSNDTALIHGGATSIYQEAVAAEASRGNIGNLTVAHNARDFATLLGRGDWDLVVYNAPVPSSAQPYDQALSRLICEGRTGYIISDTRDAAAADDILKCAGATRRESTTTTDKTYLTPGTSQLFPSRLALSNPAVRGAKSWALSGGASQASYAGGLQGSASIAVGGPGGSGSVSYFISVLAKSAVKLKPYTFQNNTYVGEPLHPSFYVPAPYWPDCGFSQVSANVTVTRPLVSLAAVRREAGNTQGEDAPEPRIPTETHTFALNDDGTNGDRIRGDHHFETALEGYTRFDGEYKLHARIRLCNERPCGKLDCIVREAEHVLDVLPKASAKRSEFEMRKVTVDKSKRVDGRVVKRATILVTPRDEEGVALGHGNGEQLVVRGVCGLTVASFEEYPDDGDADGRYAITVSYDLDGEQDSACGRPGVSIHSYGRPDDALVVDL